MIWRAGLAAWLSSLALAWAGAACAAAAPPGPFGDWAAVVVAGDWHGHSGAATEAFDNARRDVSKALVGAGFDAANLHQFSVRPRRYKDARPLKSDIEGIHDALAQASAKARGGCLVYFTSHGAPRGILVGDRVLGPSTLASMIDEACGERPTVVVLSACFSGVFVKELALPNRMILTAARQDRASFGCGEADLYPYFDECFLGAFPKARDFAALGPAVQACVAAREIEEDARPPSEPQLWIGPKLRPLLGLYPFPRRSP